MVDGCFHGPKSLSLPPSTITGFLLARDSIFDCRLVPKKSTPITHPLVPKITFKTLRVASVA